MKKTLVIVSFVTAFITTSSNAQSLQEGKNHLYADRFGNAVSVFQKLLAANPNMMEATYWLGQTYLDMDDNDAARDLYNKALMANGNAPLIMVGKGHVLLLDKKIDEARQMFESAITISHTRKGDDPEILNAIGAANVDAKQGNYQYAIQVLEQALQRDPKNAEIALNLGNAHRKATPGSGGGRAYEFYQMAIQLNSKFVYPYIRIAQLFETQQNWDLVLENLNKAIQIDPDFSKAYYELFYYHFYKQNYDEATKLFDKYVASRASEDHVEDDYLHSQLCWAKKDYDCAITKAESVKVAMGNKVKPRVFRQLAYSYTGKSDFVNAKKNIDEFFVRTKDGPEPTDFFLKAEIYSGSGVPCPQLYNVYLEGAAADTVLQSKIDFLNKAADYFKTKDCRLQEADMRLLVYNTRPNSHPSGLFNLGLNYMQAGELIRADSFFQAYNTAFPDSVYGYSYRGRINYTIDTTMTIEPYVSNLLQNYEKSLTIASKDKIRLKSHGITAARALAIYYVNVRSSRDTALGYVYRGLEIDSTDATLKYIKEILEKVPNSKPTGQPRSQANTKPNSGILATEQNSQTITRK